MAHQAHNIPWNNLASNLKPVFAEPGTNNVSNFNLRFKANQGKELNHFTLALAKNIEEHTKCERRKYPGQYGKPQNGDTILTDAVIRKICPTASRLGLYRCPDQPPRGYSLKPAGTGRSCCHGETCPIPPEERKTAAFIRSYKPSGCYEFFYENEASFFNLEVVKILLLFGEMDPILRACAHPNVGYAVWWSVCQCQCMDRDAGWDRICELALDAYICLNLLYCFPETWDLASGRTEKTDYRRTKLYQAMLGHCTADGYTSLAPSRPHQQFFGIAVASGRKIPYGTLTFGDFLRFQGLDPDTPSFSDVDEVRGLLRVKGLPNELAIMVMESAGYACPHRLVVPHDPLHHENRDELGKYLKYCWQLIIRCNMMANALGMSVPWESRVTAAIARHVTGPGGRRGHRSRTEYSDDDLFFI